MTDQNNEDLLAEYGGGRDYDYVVNQIERSETEYWHLYAGSIWDDLIVLGDHERGEHVLGRSGDDTITDFTDGEDTIDLSALTGVAGFGDLTITQVGDDARIDTREGTITLQNFDIGDLDAADFTFHEAPVDSMQPAAMATRTGTGMENSHG